MVGAVQLGEARGPEQWGEETVQDSLGADLVRLGFGWEEGEKEEEEGKVQEEEEGEEGERRREEERGGGGGGGGEEGEANRKMTRL